jgi:hypothetical protein
MKMKKIKIKKINNRRRSAQRIQDKIFMKMSAEKKLLLLDEFFRLAKKLQNLNDRKCAN